MLIFYDFEVFHFDWLVVLILPQTKEIVIIHNDKDQLEAFYEAHKNYIWIGYNSKNYDTYILKSILLEMNPYDVSKHIINGGNGWEYSNLFNKIPLYNYDAVIKQGGISISLKVLEGYMGESIEESEVSFDLDRPLTPEELEDVKNYCIHDVEQLIMVMIQKDPKADFDTQLALLSEFKLPMKYVGKTQSQLAAIILGAKRRTYNDEFQLRLPDTILIKKPEYQDIFLWYTNEGNYNYDLKQSVIVAGVPHEFGWGGIHGATANANEEGYILNMDVGLTQWPN